MDGGEARAGAAGARAGGSPSSGVRVGSWAAFARLWRSGLSFLLHTTVPLPRPSRWAWTADASLALLLAACTVGAALAQDVSAVLQLPSAVVTPGPGGGPVVPVPPPPPLPSPAYPGQDLGGVDTWQLLLAALTALPLLVRRRYPLTAFWAVIVTTMVLNQRLGAGDTTVYTFLTCLVAAYSAAVHSPYRLRALTSLVAGAALIAAFVEENFPYVTPAVIPFLVLLGVGLGANAIHTWKQRVHALQEEQEAATRLAVEHERSRIARELHDVVTHNVSVMVIQAGAARKVMDVAPDRAREALLAVEAGGRTAMTELRHVMGLLTMTEDDQTATAGVGAGGGAGPSGHEAGPTGFGARPTGRARPAGSWSGPGAAGSWAGPAVDTELAPQPGLDQLPALTSRVRASGVPVELTVTGTPSPLSPGAGLAAYRVVQEALTNTVKHAAGARVRVTVDHTPTEVRLEVTDTGGTRTSAAASGTGRGLLGLRERLAVHGGTLRTGPRPTGGYRVQAVIPLDDAPTENRPAGASPAAGPRPVDPTAAYPTAVGTTAVDTMAVGTTAVSTTAVDLAAVGPTDTDPTDRNPSLEDPPVEDSSTTNPPAVDRPAGPPPAADRPAGPPPTADPPTADRPAEPPPTADPPTADRPAEPPPTPDRRAVSPPAVSPPVAAPPDGPPVARAQAAEIPPAADLPSDPTATATGNPPPGHAS
ncbi:histidine kinase [Streptomyces europaeiscabiei]